MISVRNLRKAFGTDRTKHGAIQDLSLDIPDGAFYALVGPSGCGKTTTLRCIAGLEAPDSGEIDISGMTVFSSTRRINVPAHRRSIGMVFQTYAIWPHMTVFQNVAYPLKNERRSKTEIRAAVTEALEMVGLADKMERPAPFLSGGEQQRVALARALVYRPRVLLLDEPLSNLDANLREQMRFELRELHQRIGFTALYVTHDQDEAFALADVMAVMRAGEIMELDRPDALYRAPRTSFGATFLGIASQVPGEVVEADTAGGMCLATPLGVLECAANEELRPRMSATMYVRPEAVEILDESPPIPARAGIVPMQLDRFLPLGGIVDFWLSANGIAVRGRALALEPTVQLLERSVGRPVTVRIAPSVVHRIDDDEADETDRGAASAGPEPMAASRMNSARSITPPLGGQHDQSNLHLGRGSRR